MFTETSVATPTLVPDDMFPTIPSSVDVFGQMVDTSPLASALEPWQALAKSALSAVGDAAEPGRYCSPPHDMMPVNVCLADVAHHIIVSI
jgi:hypothetical protein